MAFAAFGSAPAAKSGAPTKSSRIAWILLAPGLAYLAAFFLTPLFSLIITSLQVPDASGEIGRYQYGFAIENYWNVIETYLPQILRSFAYAIAATILALIISYPLAYFIGVKARRWPLLQGLMLTLVIAPFFISFLLRTFAWKQIFSNESWIVTTLQTLGMLAPDQYLVGTDFMVIFGLTYNFIPFMTLPLYTALDRLDLRYLEAGADLYASPATTFRKITLPLTMPGIISGTLLTFIPIAGDYINASRDFLGSSDTTMMGNVVESNFLRINDYPSASALSVLLMGAILALVFFYVKRSGTEDLL
ncbi:ABC transporter permease [Candidatus Rhodoluna planktonica]|uniref:ABC transporter permease n=1 Tax=Candidatus Rhodoluna planktonica TaxID=535712 RepID=A0A1D9DZM6_9MICO|nr:ABC transporter permease [Candidatus Rhodoluna planktonica]AOY56263.1 ABC transporter permease [Candidatus Rhodoluna planktonica]